MTAKHAALEAGKLLMKHYGKLKNSQISQKSRNDFVTTVDKLSEKLIKREFSPTDQKRLLETIERELPSLATA